MIRPSLNTGITAFKHHPKTYLVSATSTYLLVFSIGFKRLFFYVFVFCCGIAVCLGIITYYVFVFKIPRKTHHKPVNHFTFMLKDEWQRQKQTLAVDNDALMQPVMEESFLISETLDEFISLILQSFISGWYGRITSDSTFESSVTIELKHVFRMVKDRLENVDLARLMVTKICPIINDHIVDYIRAVDRVQTKINTNKGGVAPLDHDIDVARQYRRGKIHPAVTITKTGINDANEKQYLRTKVGQILPFLLSERESKNEIGVSLVREILACTILANIFQLIGEGDFYNLMIVKLIGDNLKRRDQVKKLREALDEHTKKHTSKTPNLDDTNKLKDCIITENMDIVSYNNCLERINQKTSLDELKQLRVYVSFQLLQTPKDTKILPRLKEVQGLVESKIKYLEANSGITLNKALNIKPILEEFSKFLKERSRTYLLQFWLCVEKTKSPLELQDDKLSLTMGFTNSKEVASIYSDFLKTNRVKIPLKDLRIIEEYIHSKDLITKNELYKKARDVLFKLQADVFAAMEIDFQEFSKTEVFKSLSLQVQDKQRVDGYVSPVVIKAVEDAFTQIMKSNNDFSTLDTRRQISTTDLTKGIFGDSFDTLEPSVHSNRNSRLFDDLSDESGTDNESLNFDSDTNSNLQNSVELDPDTDNDMEGSQSLLLAAPGDLKLAEEIDRISEEIDRLNEQQNILLPLITKAELSRNISELKILKNSQLSLEREINAKELQKQQYIVQENDNSLYGKSTVSIKSYVGGNEDGKDFILYIIEVQRFSDNETNTSGWIIARRFSQFFKLHEYLRARYPEVNELKFPKRTMFKLNQKQIIELRKNLLEEYLQNLLKISEVCGDRVFRSFLSSENFNIRGRDRAQIRSKKTAMESVANTFYNGISSKLSGRKPNKDGPKAQIDEEMVKNLKEMEKELKSFEEREIFIKPLINLLMTVFKLKNARSWLRGRALLVILQQIFGTTIEKKIYEQIGQVKQEENILDVLIMIKNLVFPDGRFRDSPVPRTPLEKETTREESKFLLNSFMGESFNTIFGVSNTKYAFSVVFNSIQNDFLVKHLVFEIFDELIVSLFPEIQQ